MYKKILVPIDSSKTSARGLEEAIKLAKAEGARLFLLHVVDEFIALQDAMGAGFYAGELFEGLREGGRRLLARAEARVRARGLPVRSILVEEPAARVAEVIVAQAKKLGAQIIVLGTHGRRGVSRLVMGSDAEGVLREANVPVLLVRAPEGEAAPSAARRRAR
ncbi:MAG: universal stress protein [Burkholderiales bacterium]|nr:universal stress protein [Burkholderiales bacterium]